ncbi:MAG: hypothetical protein ACOCP4_04315 [Candidatus Woesearchaeota archaeon]
MKQKISVKSSSSESIYSVVFEIDNDTLRVHCDCQAGIYGKLCKHKINILEGDTSNIIDLKEYNEISDILSKVNNSDFATKNNSVKEIDNEIKKMNSKKKKLKKELEQMLSSGFNI